LELQVAEAAQTNTAFINNMKTSDTKQVVMYEEQLKKLREELEAAFKVTKDQKEAHDREMGVLKAQLEETIQAKDGDHSAKLNLTRATAAEAKVSQLQHQLLSLQSQNEELVTFKKVHFLLYTSNLFILV
jgi:ABC-type phosphate transport system auxiliary subunit